MGAGGPRRSATEQEIRDVSMRPIAKRHREREICLEKRKNRYDARTYSEAEKSLK
jgi:hypothetical protein